jgi:capsular exopolysaccharide synthesis family protein
MSKMFDDLKKAEESRKGKAAEPEGQEVPSEQSRPIVDLAQPGTSAGLPDDLFRELGILKNSLESFLEGKGMKSLIFSSSTSGEGATTIAVNYARVLALQGKEKVLLCEVNARKPSFDRIFSLSDSVGVVDVFTGDSSLDSAIHKIKNSNLAVVPVGRPDPSLIQLHMAEVLPGLLERAAKEYTTIVFDAPPISSSPETPAMSRFVDGVVIVVQSGKTKREVVQRSINAVARLDGKVLGVVLNRKKYYIPEFLYKRL